ncbi:SigB/SigF/SigG family RNA polymerase sigma factor [Streptodolium elevatio]
MPTTTAPALPATELVDDANLPDATDEHAPLAREEMRSLGRDGLRAHTDRLLRRLARLEPGTETFGRTRAEVIELNTGLVKHLVRRFVRSGEDFDDVYQTGLVGLVKAVDRYDVERGTGFISFAQPTITGEIKRHFRDTSWAVHVPRGHQELFLVVVKTADQLQTELGRDATDEEIADRLGTTADEVRAGRAAADAHRVGSLDAPMSASSGRGDRPLPLQDTLGAEDPGIELAEFRASVAPLIAELPERDQKILRWRFWDDLTQRQIGERLGLSQMHISRLLTSVLSRLRAHLEADGVAANTALPAAA